MKTQNLRWYRLAVLLLLSSIAIYSCRPDKTTTTTDNTTKFDNSQMTKASFTGQVMKEDGTPLENALVSTGTHMISTDADGFFYFADINTPKRATLIKVEKAGYFKAYRTVEVIANKDNHVRIMAMSLPQAETFNANSGGTVNISSGGSIKFNANSIVDDATGQAYSGTVSVYAKWLDPSAADINLKMPGDLRGISTEGAEESLVTYGMQAVEMYGSSGQKLQIASGSEAELKFPLPSSFQSASPASVPLWYFDEAKSMWIEEGIATRSGNDYVGKVSHFSFWNCDYGAPIVNFTCRIVDASNNPIAGAYVYLATTSSAIGTRWAYTNSNGEVSGGIPVNTNFDLKYVHAGCNYTYAPIFLQSFSTTTTNVNLGNITAPPVTGGTMISGQVEDCNGNTLSNAPVKLSTGGNIFITSTNASGSFNFNVSCFSPGNAGVITAYDVANVVNGQSTITMAAGALNAGTVTACGVQSDYITIQVTNPPAVTPTTYSIIAPAASFWQAYGQNTTWINGWGPSTPGPNGYFGCNIGFDGPPTVTGTHNLLDYGDNVDSMLTLAPASVTLTSYGAIGAKIKGSFSTTATGLVYNSALINCDFSVTRTQ